MPFEYPVSWSDVGMRTPGSSRVQKSRNNSGVMTATRQRLNQRRQYVSYRRSSQLLESVRGLNGFHKIAVLKSADEIRLGIGFSQRKSADDVT